MKNQPKQLLIAGGMAFGVASLGMAGSASAAILFTPVQTLAFGPAVPTWTHTFSFEPFIAPDPTATFNSVHITITGTLQDTGAGNIVCVGASSYTCPLRGHVHADVDIYGCVCACFFLPRLLSARCPWSWKTHSTSPRRLHSGTAFKITLKPRQPIVLHT